MLTTKENVMPEKKQGKELSLFIIHDELEAEKMNQWIISWNQFFINKVLQASNQKIKFSQITLFLENAFI